MENNTLNGYRQIDKQIEKIRKFNWIEKEFNKNNNNNNIYLIIDDI